MMTTSAAGAQPSDEPDRTLLLTGVQGALGSTVGPDGALYVTEAAAGRLSRVDPITGQITTVASGLPGQILPGLGGAVDVAFVGRTAYVLETFNGTDVGGSTEVGIYRVDGPHKFRVIADIGAFNVSHPPDTDFQAPQGVQTSLQRFRGGFIVTDGHLNRMLRVSLDGESPC